MLDTLMPFLKEIFEKVDLKKKSADDKKLPSRQRVDAIKETKSATMNIFQKRIFSF